MIVEHPTPSIPVSDVPAAQLVRYQEDYWVTNAGDNFVQSPDRMLTSLTTGHSVSVAPTTLVVPFPMARVVVE